MNVEQLLNWKTKFLIQIDVHLLVIAFLLRVWYGFSCLSFFFFFNTTNQDYLFGNNNKKIEPHVQVMPFSRCTVQYLWSTQFFFRVIFVLFCFVSVHVFWWHSILLYMWNSSTIFFKPYITNKRIGRKKNRFIFKFLKCVDRHLISCCSSFHNFFLFRLSQSIILHLS